MCVCMFVYVCVCTCMCVYVCVHACVYMCVYMHVCVCVCVHACMYMSVCVCGGRGVFTEIVSGGQRVSICSQEIFPPSEKHFTCVIPKEGKEEKVK